MPLLWERRSPRFAAVLVEAEQVAKRNRCAVPFGALKDLEGHGGAMVMQPLTPIKNGENIHPLRAFGGWMAR